MTLSWSQPSGSILPSSCWKRSRPPIRRCLDSQLDRLLCRSILERERLCRSRQIAAFHDDVLIAVPLDLQERRRLREESCRGQEGVLGRNEAEHRFGLRVALDA